MVAESSNNQIRVGTLSSRRQKKINSKYIVFFFMFVLFVVGFVYYGVHTYNEDHLSLNVLENRVYSYQQKKQYSKAITLILSQSKHNQPLYQGILASVYVNSNMNVNALSIYQKLYSNNNLNYTEAQTAANLEIKKHNTQLAIQYFERSKSLASSSKNDPVGKAQVQYNQVQINALEGRK